VSPPTLSGDARRRHPSLAPGSAQSFAHPSEEIFARLLTLYGHEWLSEPLEFPLAWNDDGTTARAFRPDFYLPEHGIFLELTTLRQDLVTAKNRKVRQLTELYPDVQVKMLYRRDIVALIDKYHLDSTPRLAG